MCDCLCWAPSTFYLLLLFSAKKKQCKCVFSIVSDRSRSKSWYCKVRVDSACHKTPDFGERGSIWWQLSSPINPPSSSPPIKPTSHDCADCGPCNFLHYTDIESVAVVPRCWSTHLKHFRMQVLAHPHVDRRHQKSNNWPLWLMHNLIFFLSHSHMAVTCKDEGEHRGPMLLHLRGCFSSTPSWWDIKTDF